MYTSGAVTAPLTSSVGGIALTPREEDAQLRLDFAAFAQRCYRELNPLGAFAMNWHVEVMAAKLTAVSQGRTRRLIVNKAYKIDKIGFIFHPSAPGRARCVSAWHKGGMATLCSGRSPWRREVSDTNALLQSLL